MTDNKMTEQMAKSPTGTSIRHITENKKQYLELLLLGDEQETMIDRYLERGDMYVMFDRYDRAIAVAVVTDEGEGVCELKNIAVAPDCQRRGYGTEFIKYLFGIYCHAFSTMLVGTGSTVGTLKFYEHCGFTYSHTVKDFFTDNYDHKIIEDGKELRDMIYLRRILAATPDAAKG